VVRERDALVGRLQNLLRDIGLERRAKAVVDFKAYIEGKGQKETA